MNMRFRVASGSIAAAAVLLATTPAGAGTKQSLHGTFSETSAGAELGYDIHGSAKMTVGDGSTVVKVNISGLHPDKHYGSHLHNATCAAGGGGHYQDVEGGAITHGNELHLSTSPNPDDGITPNRGGVAHAGGTTEWEARLSATQTNARSIVVHEEFVTGAANRITCADLT